MSSFYQTIETLPKNAPGSFDPSGKRSKLVDNLIQRAIGSAGRVKDNMTFRGMVLYQTPIPEKVFKEKFWPDFVNYVLPQRHAKRNTKKSIPIMEYIVYIPELCGCLPRPAAADAKQFFDSIEELQVKNFRDSNQAAPGTEKSKYDVLRNSSEDLRKIKNSERYIRMIKRFPKVYSALGEELGYGESGIGSTIIVAKFPYEYDTSAGVAIAPKS